MLFLTILSAALTLVNAQDLKTGGRWTVVGSQPVVCIHTALLPNNKVLCLERPHVAPYPPNPFTRGHVAAVFDLNTGETTVVPQLLNPFCAGHAQMADGSILVVGGDEAAIAPLSDGRTAQRAFKPCTPGQAGCTVGTWGTSTFMSTGRWYPTVVTIHDGRQIIFSGSLKNMVYDKVVEERSITNNPTYEYYPPKTGLWPKRLEILDKHYPFNLYPPAFQIPGEKILLFVSNETVILDTNTDTVSSNIPVVTTETKYPWIYPYTPTAVMFPLTKANNWTPTVMVCGGSIQSSSADYNLQADNRCIKLNLGAANPSWQPGKPMLNRRVMPDSVILADGSILFIGGSNYGLAGGEAGEYVNAPNPVFKAEIYDPVKDTFTAVNEMAVARLYHSGGVLLEDGRALITGSEMQNYPDANSPNTNNCFPKDRTKACTSPFEYRMEAFEPPYMFLDVEAPKLLTAPSSVTYQSTFAVTVGTDAGRINKVAMIRYSTSTHSTNTDQRYVEVEVVSRNRSYVVIRAPSSGSIAPPGNYHLFMSRDGKPGKAMTINLGAGAVTNAPLPANPISEPSSSLRNAPIVSLIGLFSLVLVWFL